jgi:cytochrome c oxidase assembly protein subunit 15
MSGTASEGDEAAAVRETVGDGSRFGFPQYLLVTLAGTFLLMLVGAYTKAIGAGLACPDWPQCYGVWVPFLSGEVMAEAPFTAHQIAAEWTHRGLAMVVGFAIIGAALWSWRRAARPAIRYALYVAALILPLQVVFGALTVTEGLEPVIVTTHLGTATVILMALTVATTVAWLDPGAGPGGGVSGDGGDATDA